MTKREAKRRLENLALETGHKKNYYVKRALNEFLDRNEHLLGHGPMRTLGFSILDQVPYRLNKFPSWYLSCSVPAAAASKYLARYFHGRGGRPQRGRQVRVLWFIAEANYFADWSPAPSIRLISWITPSVPRNTSPFQNLRTLNPRACRSSVRLSS